MLKRQETSLSSSSRRSTAASTPPPQETHHAKAVGCMPGIFRLFSKYQNPNKRITFGRKQEKSKPLYSTKIEKFPPAAKEDGIKNQTIDNRSLTIHPEIRRSSAAVSTVAENPRTPPSPSLMARLMGLKDISAAEKKPTAAEEDHITESRLLLLQSLEKCNEDLEALARIINAVQTADGRVQALPRAAAAKMFLRECGDAVDEEANTPAGTMEELTRSPLNSVSPVQNSTADGTRVPHMRKPTLGKKPGEDDEPITKLFNKSSIIESSLCLRRQAAAAIAPPWCSRAMVKSVEEVCDDIVWGEKREVGRIGLVLQDHLCRDLVEELVSELRSYNIYSLPFDSCKRKLCF